MASKALQLTVSITGVRETLAAFRALPKDASKELRVASQAISKRLAAAAATNGRAEGFQAALVARTVKAGFDRVPVVTAGGTRSVGSRRVPAWKLLFGSEFGSTRYTQFPRAHQGTRGVWFFPTIEEQDGAIQAEWQDAADRIIKAFSGGSD